MNVVGFYPQFPTTTAEIGIYKNIFVKNGFTYLCTTRTFDELHTMLNTHNVHVVASKDFNEYGSGTERLRLVLLLQQKACRYFDVEIGDIQNLKEELVTWQLEQG